MKTSLVKNEIKRFLRSSVPEVLCIRGKWGVGKTYTWKQYLTEINSDYIGLSHYSYISLFGLNSLEALKYAIFENTVSTNKITGNPDLSTFSQNIADSGIKQKIRILAEPLLNWFGNKDAGDAIGRALFLSVKQRIICIDDLERVGSALEIRDVLGLVSMLKEERECKIVLLLNDQELKDKNKKDFEGLLEKVIDVSLFFEPTTDEAVDIALQNDTESYVFMRSRIIQLGIINIRIIKKIERLALQLLNILDGRKKEVVEKAISTVVIGTWAQLATNDAPSLEIIQNYHRGMESVMEFDALPDEQKNTWTAIFDNYGYQYSDDFNHEIIEGIKWGYFDSEAIIAHADKLEYDIDNNKLDNSFTQAWEKYHGSFNIDDDVILDLLYNTAIENLTIINLGSVNSTVKLLRECEREDQASQLVKQYIAENNFEKNILGDSMTRAFISGSIDPEIKAELNNIDEQYVDTREPIEVMRKITNNRSWNPEDITLLSRVSPENYEKIFHELEGRELSSIAKFLIARSDDGDENNKKMGQALRAGLERIANKSYLRAERIKSYGIDL